MMQIKNSSENHRSIAQIFSASNFRRILNKDDFSVIDDKLSRLISFEEKISRKDQLNLIYSYLFENYRSEYLYKNTLINKTLLGKYSTTTSTAFDEFKVGNSIADFMLLNGEAKIYEIKTELDSLEKLDKQILEYSKFANSINIVTNSKFLPALTQKYFGTNIGLIELTKKNTLKTIIKARSNTKNFDHEIIFKTLRKNEYLNITFNNFGYIPDVPNTKIFKSCLKLLKEIPVSKFQSEAVKELKKRKLKCPHKLSSNEVPYELKYICHSLDLRNSQYNKLNKFLNQK